jgi:hypothetical protein
VPQQNQRNLHSITLLVEKGHSVLAIGQNAGEVAGIKFKLKRFLKKHRYNHFNLNPARQKIITTI